MGGKTALSTRYKHDRPKAANEAASSEQIHAATISRKPRAIEKREFNEKQNG